MGRGTERGGDPLLLCLRKGGSLGGWSSQARRDGAGVPRTQRSAPGTPKDEMVEAGRGPGAGGGWGGASGTRTHGLVHALSARGPALRASANDLVQIEFKGDRRSSAPRRLSIEKGGRRGSKEERIGKELEEGVPVVVRAGRGPGTLVGDASWVSVSSLDLKSHS